MFGSVFPPHPGKVSTHRADSQSPNPHLNTFFIFSLLEAARDLGATKLGSMIHVLLPNIRSGVYTAVLFTFIPIFGAYAVPLLVGGKDSYMLGNIIADQLTKSRNWPLASAISMVLTLVTTIGVMVMMNLQKKDASRTVEAGHSTKALGAAK
ncbi:hypothetical protein FACS1894106_4610 [Spirochaetia bacterium]|nr:hypothetical protein FACS1894106_4610 [Spirochaetia bacterium]